MIASIMSRDMLSVVVYTTTTCPFCKMEKEYLDSKNIKYSEILVDQNPEAAQKMISMSGQLGVPFTVITKENDEEIKILGYDKPRLDEELSLINKI